MAKYYKKKERREAYTFLMQNPIILEKIRCVLNEPSLSDKKIRKLLSHMITNMLDFKEEYYGDEIEFIKESKKDKKFDVDEYLDNI